MSAYLISDWRSPKTEPGWHHFLSPTSIILALDCPLRRLRLTRPAARRLAASGHQVPRCSSCLPLARRALAAASSATVPERHLMSSLRVCRRSNPRGQHLCARINWTGGLHDAGSWMPASRYRACSSRSTRRPMRWNDAPPMDHDMRCYLQYVHTVPYGSGLVCC